MTRRNRKGFTLIELLVVLGVIIVLISIAVLGYFHLDKVAAEKMTRTRLEMCKSMFWEYQGNTSISSIEGAGGILATPPTVYLPGAMCNNPGSVALGSPYRDLFLALPSSNGTNPYSTQSTVAPSYTSGTPISATSYGYTDTNPNSTPPGNQTTVKMTAVQATGMIFLVMSHDPKVKAMLNALPASAFLNTISSFSVNTAGDLQPSTSGPGPYADPNSAVVFPVILDGWNNPIIYVPSGGMRVWAGGPMPDTFVTGGVATYLSGVWGRPYTVTASAGGPFFASAGADGNFNTNDDNLYSSPVTLTPVPTPP